jgi:hypothetical protein
MALTKISASVIAANAIVAAGVAENSISTSEIATDGVGTLQISDGAVTSGKLETNVDIAGTLDVTGVLTADSNVVIAGNLTVNGATVTNSSTNTTIADALIELGTGTTGSPANDAGIVIERGDSDNAFIGWDESADTFILGTGSFTGASTGNLTISTAPLSVGALTASGITYPTSDGSSGQVLKTDGSGNLTFDAQTAVVDNFTATGDGSTTDFDTGINPGDEVNTWVFIDGVYQQKGEYSYSGSTISFSTAPDSGATIDVTTGTVGGFASADSVLGVYEATTTNTDTYATGISASNENNTWVFVGGVYQPKDSYTFSSGTLTFDANTPTGQKLSVTATKSLSAGSVETNTITANAVTSAKIASNSILSRHIANNSIVGADISATTQITASTFTGALTGDVTGNVVGNLTGTIQTAAQTNITSVGTLSALTVSGNVGIGASTPDYQLHIAGGGDLLVEDTGNGSAHIRLRSSNSGTSSSDWKLKTSSNNYFYIDNDTGGAGTAIAIDNSGKVGIGTSNPSSYDGVLNLESSSAPIADFNSTSATGGFIKFQRSGTTKGYIGTPAAYMASGGVDDLGIRAQGNFTIATGGANERLRIDSAGKVGIGTSPSEMLHILGGGSGPEIRLENSSGSHYIRAYDNNWNFLANSTNTAMTIRNDGQVEFGGLVGIGTTIPTEKLTVNGQIAGGFGATTTGGTADFNHVTNARSGMGYSLINAQDTNGMGSGTAYYHVVNYEYVNKNGSGNMTQIAIGYNDTRQFMRYRFNGTWSSWHEM